MKLEDFKQSARKLLADRKLMVAIGVYLLGAVLFVGFFYFRSHPPTSQTPISQTGIIVQQSYDGALPLKPIDQDKYRKIIEKSWEEALVRGSTNIVNFPNDPNLIAFQYKYPDASAPASFVLYRNKPIILRTKKVLELPDAQTSRLTLSHEKYQLVVLFEFTPEVKELNIAPILKDAFEAMVQGK